MGQPVQPGCAGSEAGEGRTRRRGGYWLWEGEEGGISVRFVGRGPAAERAEVLRSTGPTPRLDVAWPRQVHSARVLIAAPRQCGTGDALWTQRSDLALSIQTADCVPLLLGGGGAVAAAHAGWRGIAAGVVPAVLRSLGVHPAQLTAWIGPAIGPCCYEVGKEVANEVAAASTLKVVEHGAAKPHLDLPGAVGHQLEAAGVSRIRRLACCTQCRSDDFFSYRRSGQGAGRNLAFVWLSPAQRSP